jgi:hypothetical protein
MGRKSIAKILNPRATRKEVTQFNNIMKSIENYERAVQREKAVTERTVSDRTESNNPQDSAGVVIEKCVKERNT